MQGTQRTLLFALFALVLLPALALAQVDTVTVLTSSPGPSVFGQSVTFTATVTSAGGTPTGSVSFGDGGTFLGSGTLSGGVAVFTTSALSTGSHTMVAGYLGGVGFNSSAGLMTQVVNQASTTTVVTSSRNPLVTGQSVTFTATVAAAAPGAGTPTGTVAFLDGANTIGTGTVSGGTATFSTAALASGNHTISAIYGGDGNFLASSGALAASQAVNPASVPTLSSIGLAMLAMLLTASVAVLARRPAGRQS